MFRSWKLNKFWYVACNSICKNKNIKPHFISFRGMHCLYLCLLEFNNRFIYRSLLRQWMMELKFLRRISDNSSTLINPTASHLLNRISIRPQLLEIYSWILIALSMYFPKIVYSPMHIKSRKTNNPIMIIIERYFFIHQLLEFPIFCLDR